MSLYHPIIQIHASLMRGGSDMRRDSTVDSASAALRRWYSWVLTLIVWLSTIEFRWSPLQSAATLVSTRH